MPEGREDDVFAPFTQVHADEGADERSGIGLARCRIFAAAHGGSITLESTPEGGCTVTVRL